MTKVKKSVTCFAQLPIKKRDDHAGTIRKSGLATLHKHLSCKPPKKRYSGLNKQSHIRKIYLPELIKVIKFTQQLESDQRMQNLQMIEDLEIKNILIYFNLVKPLWK